MRNSRAGKPSLSTSRAARRGGVDAGGFAAQSRGYGACSEGASAVERPCLVFGHNSRLAQVITNLVDNACSFSKPAARCAFALSRVADDSRLSTRRRAIASSSRSKTTVRAFRPTRWSDFRALLHGPAGGGIWPEFGARIVDLAADRQAHLGRIWAENRPFPKASADCGRRKDEFRPDGAPRHRAGARFIVSLPAFVK